MTEPSHQRGELVDLWDHGVYFHCSCGALIHGGSAYLASVEFERHAVTARQRETTAAALAAYQTDAG